ncbi:hypothetical protein IM538_04055 [Cytobacillus suaedae]|nr:hypothetical protein IM538_04055 [Cytobacillus suaedae]
MLIVTLFFGALTYYVVFFTPKDSLELYQAISFADSFKDAQKLSLEGYEHRFEKEDFDYIGRVDTQAESVQQFTLFQFEEKTYLIMTSPGTLRLKVLAVEELPEEVRDYFLEIAP